MPKSLERARRRVDNATDRVDNATDRVERQARGTARNTRELADSFAFDRILPNGISGLVEEVLRTVAFAAGRGTAKQQVWASIKAIVLAVVVSPFTLGYSLILGAPFAVTLLIGLLRLAPAANERFRRSRGDKLRNRDIPWWRDE